MTIYAQTLFRKLALELSLDLGTVTYCIRRFKSEGMQFFTVTLPKLSKCVLRSLELGYFDRNELTCFAWKGRSLRYFRSLLDKIFDSSSGRVLADVDPYYIWAVRQLGDYFYKLSLPFDEDELKVAEDKFVKNESLIDEVYDHSREHLDNMRRNIETYYDFPKDYSVVLTEKRPRYGPGTYSIDPSRRRGNRARPYYLAKVSKAECRSYPIGFRDVCGFFRSYPSCPTYLREREDTSELSEVLFVPKDSRGPRTIVREPLKVLQLQMSYFDYFSSHFCSLTNGRINFHDQSANQKLAALGSIDGSYSTFDLKDASDMLSYNMCRSLFQNIPSINWFLRRARTSTTKLPSGRSLKLKKLSGMGSGLTFATMAFVIHTSIATKIAKHTGISFLTAGRSVFVYGDDVIVPFQYSKYVPEALRDVGLLLNSEKSYFRRYLGQSQFFRESCGGDYFRGVDVGVVRARFPSGVTFTKDGLTATSDEGLTALCSHAWQLHSNGLTSLSEVYYAYLERILGKLPKANRLSSMLTRHTFGRVGYSTDETGLYEPVKGFIVTSPKVQGEIDPYFLVGKSLQKDKDVNLHLSDRFAVVPRSVRLKKRTVSSFSLEN